VRPRGVVVMGPGRSGTSMVAGLLAAHGVFFGTTKPADQHNPRGYYEHLAIPLPRAKAPRWPGSFFRRLRREGWDGRTLWGVKHMTTRWHWFRQLLPSLIVLTVRPDADVMASLRRTGWPLNPERLVRNYHRRVRRIRREASCPIVTVSTPALIRGEYDEIRRVFALLGLTFSEEIARAWIDPAAWNQGARP
jgi:hypothetical protein